MCFDGPGLTTQQIQERRRVGERVDRPGGTGSGPGEQPGQLGAGPIDPFGQRVEGLISLADARAKYDAADDAAQKTYSGRG